MNYNAKKGQRSDLLYDIYKFHERFSYFNKAIKPSKSHIIIGIGLTLLMIIALASHIGVINKLFAQIVAVFSIVFYLYAVQKTNKYVYGNFKKYQNYFMKNKLVRKFWPDTAFMRQYRIDELRDGLEAIFHLNDQEKAQCVIEIIQIEKEKLKERNWWPFTLLALVAFPLWSEYVGFRFNVIVDNTEHLPGETIPSLGIDLLFSVLLPVALILFMLTFFAQKILKNVFLSQYEKLSEIEEFIRLIKIDLPK